MYCRSRKVFSSGWPARGKTVSAEFLETPRRLGTLGHTADKEGHELFRSQVDESENLREDARNLMLFEWARELLQGGDDVDE